MSIGRRTVLAWVAFCVLFGGGWCPLAAEELPSGYIRELESYMIGDERRRDYPKSLEDPSFLTVTDASLYMEPQDVVFVEEPHDGIEQVFVYPQSILALHEVLNLRKDGHPRSITYCPLTGTVIGISARVNHLYTTTFGNMDMLVNSNRVLYDRQTNSLCPQLLGVCIRGPLKNERLRRFPLLWTTWRHIERNYPQALVLSKDTPLRKLYRKDPYGRDPYGSYARDDTYYQKGGAYYPLAHMDDALPAKARVLGLARGEVAQAILEKEVKERGLASARLGLDRVVALYDRKLDAVRVFMAQADGRSLRFEMADGEIVDRETRSRWDVMGHAVSGRLRGAALERAAAVYSMWFAWKAFHPYTRLWNGPARDPLPN